MSRSGDECVVALTVLLNVLLTVLLNVPPIVLQVMSRSGDECVVALTDQWYLVYGEEAWQAATVAALEAMECYSEETKNGFRHCLGEFPRHLSGFGAWGWHERSCRTQGDGVKRQRTA
jgi:hypothetical protein